MQIRAAGFRFRPQPGVRQWASRQTARPFFYSGSSVRRMESMMFSCICLRSAPWDKKALTSDRMNKNSLKPELYLSHGR